MLVYGAFLVIIGATASGQAVLVTANSQTGVLNAVVGADAAAVRSFVGLYLHPADLAPGGLTPERRFALDRGLGLLAERGAILQAAILAPDGTVLVADEPFLAGTKAPATSGFASAVGDRQVAATLVESGAAGTVGPVETSAVIEEYLPIMDGGKVYAVVAVWRDATPILAQLDQGRLQVVLVTLSGALITAVLLYLLFRAAQNRITRQTAALLEATRRDPLTGLLNHGAIVEVLAETIDDCRTAGGGVSAALLDIDNFGLLNETYGHPAGDHALAEVSVLLRSTLPRTTVCGRYGPDEFLVVARGDDAVGLTPTLDGLRSALADLSLRFEDSERLPVTVSAGIASYPTNGESVTTLLSVAALTLDEAKASGGDAVRVAEVRTVAADYTKAFDVLHGLIIAVDTKDRYTRRHCEDVARYADFIAERLGLEPETRRALHTAGLLHDVGKIGIPDVILRKPARLTEDEYAIVKQHVALGDMIVRDIPGIELIRAGIRHHHERWDGDGYLDRLAGEEIPLVARILAVGDAFSAMTTTRSYRKALTVDEALIRLEDASGSQLDTGIVRTFVEGIRSAARPPLPGERALPRIWTPDQQVA